MMTKEQIAVIRELPSSKLAECGHGWESTMRLVGNVEARDVAAIGEAVPALLAHADALGTELAKESVRVGDWIRAHEAAREERLREVLRADELARENTALAAKLAEVERERNEQRRLLIEFGPFKMRTAEALADEVAAMVRRREIDARCPAADALLDFRNPPERFAPNVQEQLDTALAEQQRLAAEVEEIDVQLQDTQADYGKLEVEVERMRPIVTAVGTWRAFNALPGTHEDRSRAAGQIGSDLVVARYLDAIAAAHATYLATTQRAETPEPLKSNDAEVM